MSCPGQLILRVVMGAVSRLQAILNEDLAPPIPFAIASLNTEDPSLVGMYVGADGGGFLVLAVAAPAPGDGECG